MDAGKKKPGKLKKLLIGVVVVVFAFFIIGLLTGDKDETADSNTEDSAKAGEENDLPPEPDEAEGSVQDEAETPEPEDAKVSDERHQIGETVTFEADNGGEINVTLTEWGNRKDYMDNPIIYVKYMIENVGTKTVTVGNSMFDIYADDYSTKTSVVLPAEEQKAAEELFARDLSAGRKVDGIIYADIDSDSVSVIEVECGGSVFVLKDEASESHSAVMADKEGLEGIKIPSDAKADSELIEEHELSGYYGGMMGQSTISLSIYSSPEEESAGIGNAEIYVEGGEYAYNGEIAILATNVYKAAADTDEEVLLTASMSDDTIMLQLYVDGQLIEEYLMMEHYES